MARKRGKKALYEVMSKARNKPGFGRTLEKMRPKKPVPKKDEPVTNKKSAADVETSKTAAKWWRKPRVVQFNVGRVEFSMPYQLGVALVLGSVLLIVAAFRLGQLYYVTDSNQNEPAENVMETIIQEKPVEQLKVANVIEQASPVEEEESASLETEEPEPAEPVAPKSTGNNVIVIQQWGAKEDLRPVQAHFDEYGIKTEIVLENGNYFLQTKNKYDNPRTPGTDGYRALQKIIEVGAKYKGQAPPNYVTFAPNFFRDAYGKKAN
ncbi:MAG: hypothetical protein H8D56_12080 [Planctomycetes bacterium]|nr:hypothetical protein [Planctomycetota bacterium]MBL7143601.1 hypothetical protein [Phycisphaerae bacterium]